MPLEPTGFYQTHLAGLHRQLLSSPITRTYLTGTGIRFDGRALNPDDLYKLPIGVVSIVEFAHLFSVFDGSRVHEQAERVRGADQAPPGLYFTVVNSRLIQHPGKNRVGLYADPNGGTDLFIDGLHIDHYVLNERNTPPTLGTVAFALCAIMAHLGGLFHVSLLAAGAGSISASSVTTFGRSLGSMRRCGRERSPKLRTWRTAKACRMSWTQTRSRPAATRYGGWTPVYVPP